MQSVLAADVTAENGTTWPVNQRLSSCRETRGDAGTTSFLDAQEEFTSHYDHDLELLTSY